MTTRIQRKRIKGWQAPANTLNITRPGKHGNPYPVINGDVDASLANFENYLAFMNRHNNEHYQKLLRQVRDAEYIMCFCGVNNKCHGDIWIRLANEVRR